MKVRTTKLEVHSARQYIRRNHHRAGVLLILMACSLALVLAGCNSESASQESAEELARRAAEANSLTWVVMERIRIRVEAERSGTDGVASAADGSETMHLPTSVAQWYEHRTFVLACA